MSGNKVLAPGRLLSAAPPISVTKLLTPSVTVLNAECPILAKLPEASIILPAA